MAPEERYQVHWDVYDALAAVERLVVNGADDRVRCFSDYGFYDVKIGRNKKTFHCTFNYFQLVRFTVKFRLRITHQKIIMAVNFGIDLYIVGMLICR